MTSMRVIPLLLAALAAAAHADVFSCGGFVKSDVPIDFSKIKVKLLTPEGHLRHEESVNAANGYYMIPVYTKGSYSIRVSAPEGWFFEPSTFDFKLDGATDKCSLEEDINFALSAFSIDGAVLSQNGQGPTGLTLELLKDGSAIASTTTSEGGNYRFQAPPGKYTVSTEKGADVCISHASSHVEVKSSPVKVEPPLKISGYPVSIKVSSPNGSLKDAEIALFSSVDPKLPSCRSVIASDKAVEGSKFVCILGNTDSKGEVHVACIAPGSYHIKPVSEGLTFSPAVSVINVVDERVSTSFSVGGFTANGRVKVGEKPLIGVDVLINGKSVGKTDSTGSFSVSGLKDGKVSVTARAPHTTFKTHDSLHLTTTKRTIPDIVVEEFEVCGKVERSSEGGYEALKLVSEAKPSDIKSIRPDSKGEFCKFVPPGKYSIGPVATESSLAPSNTVVDVSSAPDTTLQFTHFKTDAEVKFTCIGPCDSISLSLISSRTGKSVSTAKGVDHFIFKDVSPGKYMVRLPEGSRACWEKEEVVLEVGQKKPIPAQFVQSGFTALLSLSHPATIDWQHVDQKAAKGSIEGKRGLNTLCLPAAGGYKMQISSCMVFDKPSLSLTVPSDIRLESYAVSAIVGGKINGAIPGTKIAVKSKAGDREITVDASGSFSFQEPLTSASQKLVLTPLSSTHLFTPFSHSFIFDGECEQKIVQFESAKGIFIEGSVVPIVEGVEIEAVNKNDKSVLKAKTDNNGKYRIGPIRRAEDMEITATKDGYAFAEGGKHGDLKSIKLSQLTLTFEDKATGEKLDEVMLYVRGTGEKKTSHHRVEKDGQIKLTALAPGTLIRAVVQEYELDPSTITVNTKEGEHDEKTIRGTRNAYTAFGVVREMSGAPLREVRVEALSEQCDQHQLVAMTKDDGSFRIRGLKPGCSYKIGVHGVEGSPAPHCFPSSFNVKMTDRDVKGLEMVAAPMDEGVELLVDIDVILPPSTARPPLRVEISKSSIIAFVLFGLLALFILNPQEWMERFRNVYSSMQRRASQSSSPQSVNKKRK
ncbi:nra-4 [Pristionchus pacificus]|nr:nra-4 [Pristionchus pacificus]|eukprot:PDM68075.1 nra-4 [Pristionchus pacificus]